MYLITCLFRINSSSGSFESGSYDDRLDVMSCCKGDYGLFHRTLAGWLKGSGRLVLGGDELRQRGTRRLVVWPFDRSESRGRLVSVSLRRSPGEVLLLGFRSASHWQEASSGDVPPEEARQNVRGVQVEYVRREEGQWSERGLLDFNVLHGDWPDALPSAPGTAPRRVPLPSTLECPGLAAAKGVSCLQQNSLPFPYCQTVI